MPPRGMNFDSALLKIAADPEGYAKQLEEFETRRTAADEAEARARAEEQRIAAFAKAEDAKLHVLRDAIQAEQLKLDVRERSLDERDGRQKLLADTLHDQQVSVERRETVVDNRDREQQVEYGRLHAVQAEAVEFKRAQDIREKTIGEREASVANRETLLANRAKALIADL